MNCSLCNSLLTEKVTAHFYLCSNCQSYVKDNSTFLEANLEEERYLTHNNDVNDPRYRNFTSPITQRILQDFDHQHLGLDYGCGTGPVIAEVLKENNYQVLLYDPFFQPIEENLKKKYNYIACCEVAEHFHHPNEEFAKLNQLLHKGGKLYLMTQLYEEQKSDFKDWYYIKDPTHVFIYTYESFKYIAQTFGFQVNFESNRLIVLEKIDELITTTN